ncbi:MAG: DUF4412 domain-containing protein [Candidatus Binataceae bacterium]
MNLTGKISTMLALAMLCGAAAHAGVLMEEEQSTSGSVSRPEGTNRKQTVMVEGDKQKIVMDKQYVILDVDKGMMTVVDPSDKTYSELPFSMAKSFASISYNMDFKKTGNQKTIAGYKCVEYTGSGKSPSGEYSETACYSKDAPGAAEYDKLQKAMAGKLGAEAAGAGNRPEGVPLESKKTAKITSFSMPGMSPEQAKALTQMLANRPPMTSTTTVTKITDEKLPADTFAIPQGYTKREMPHGPGPSMGKPAAPPAGNP